MTAPRLVTVSAGLRSPSATRLLADRLSAATAEALTAADRPPEVELIELRSLGHGIVDALLTGFPAGELRGAVDRVASADALIVVSPTFSASFSGLFKSFFDLFEGGALEGIPTLLGATGGTERHSLVLEHALRPLFSYLGASPLRTGVFAATGDFGGESAVRLEARIRRAAGEMADLLLARGPARRAPASADEFVPLADLLGEADPRPGAERG